MLHEHMTTETFAPRAANVALNQTTIMHQYPNRAIDRPIPLTNLGEFVIGIITTATLTASTGTAVVAPVPFAWPLSRHVHLH